MNGDQYVDKHRLRGMRVRVVIGLLKVLPTVILSACSKTQKPLCFTNRR